MKPKSPKLVLDSRHIKVLAAKKEDLKDSIVFVSLDEDKYGFYDVAQLRKLAESLDKIEPDGCYVFGLKKLKVSLYNKSEIKNRDIIITIAHQDEVEIDESDVEDRFKIAFSGAKSISFVHNYAESVEY